MSGRAASRRSSSNSRCRARQVQRLLPPYRDWRKPRRAKSRCWPSRTRNHAPWRCRSIRQPAARKPDTRAATCISRTGCLLRKRDRSDVSAFLHLPALAAHNRCRDRRSRVYKGLSLCIRGYADRGIDCALQALADARKLKHPIGLAFAIDILCVIYMLRREYRACGQLAGELSDIATEHDFVFWMANSEILRGAAFANLGRVEEGVALAERGIANWMKTDAMLHVPTWCSYLADAALISGNLARAAEAL